MLAPRKHFIDIVAVALNAGSIVLRNAAQLRADHDAGYHVGFLFQHIQHIQEYFVRRLVGNHGSDAGSRVGGKGGFRDDNPVPGPHDCQVFI